MGNNPSRASNNPNLPPGSPNTQQHGDSQQPGTSQPKGPRRRESIHALGPFKASAAPPSASLESATARPVRSRSRSQITTPTNPHFPPHISPRNASQTPTSHATPITPDTPSALASEQRLPVNSHGPPQGQSSLPSPPPPNSRPVDIPGHNRSDLGAHDDGRDRTARLEGAGDVLKSGRPMSPRARSIPLAPAAVPAEFSQPPRLPLPIQEELHTPGSPIVAPSHLASPLDYDDTGNYIPRRISVVSSSAAEDEDDGEDLASPDGAIPAVPTVIEWRDSGDRVYVTGTFAGWDRKYRLTKDGPSHNKDVLSCTVNLTPGTHHIKFIVDGEMRISEHLPTAVDFINILVNYVEVSADDLPQAATVSSIETSATPSAKPVKQYVLQPPPGPLPTSAAYPLTHIQTQPIEVRAPPGVFPPQILPPTPELRPVTPTVSAQQQATRSTGLAQTGSGQGGAVIAPGPQKNYHGEIPRFLVDLDEAEDSTSYGRANAVANTLPAPHSLPSFLNKSILNGATPAKDDASVLSNPNHTVLNHLATSSIKNKVIATSATTRYKKKFLTTILYKPTADTGD